MLNILDDTTLGHLAERHEQTGALLRVQGLPVGVMGRIKP